MFSFTNEEETIGLHTWIGFVPQLTVKVYPSCKENIQKCMLFINSKQHYQCVRRHELESYCDEIKTQIELFGQY